MPIRLQRLKESSFRGVCVEIFFILVNPRFENILCTMLKCNNVFATFSPLFLLNFDDQSAMSLPKVLPKM